MTDDYFSAWDQASWTDSDAQNKRLDDMDVPDYTLKPSPHPKSSTPRFSEWYRMPSTKRPPQIEGKRKRVYNVNVLHASEGVDMLENHYQQIQANINGHNVIVNKYDDGVYAVKSGKNVYRATDDNLDDVIDGVIS